MSGIFELVEDMDWMEAYDDEPKTSRKKGSHLSTKGAI